jgi:hypothetical protein
MIEAVGIAKGESHQNGGDDVVDEHALAKVDELLGLLALDDHLVGVAVFDERQVREIHATV